MILQLDQLSPDTPQKKTGVCFLHLRFLNPPTKKRKIPISPLLSTVKNPGSWVFFVSRPAQTNCSSLQCRFDPPGRFLWSGVFVFFWTKKHTWFFKWISFLLKIKKMSSNYKKALKGTTLVPQTLKKSCLTFRGLHLPQNPNGINVGGPWSKEQCWTKRHKMMGHFWYLC